MRLDLLDRLPLLCLGCRAAGRESRLRIATVRREEPAGDVVDGMLACPAPGCGRTYPVIDGVPVLIEPLQHYLRRERASIVGRRDLGPETRSLLDDALGDENEEWVRARYLATFSAAHDAGHLAEDPLLGPLATPFRALVTEMLARHAPPRVAGKPLLGLDAGCATGGFTRALAGAVDLAIGIDVAFYMVRDARDPSSRAHARWGPLAPGGQGEDPAIGVRPSVPGSALDDRDRTAFAVASIDALPFAPRAFDIVLALNVIDAVPQSRVAIAALDACLRPGGLLILTTPFDYRDSRTPREGRIHDADLAPEIGRAGLDILEDHPRVPWLLQVAERQHLLYFVRAIAARKRAP